MLFPHGGRAEPIERLEEMRITCALDVVEQHPEGLDQHQIAEMLGLTRQRVEEAGKLAMAKLAGDYALSAEMSLYGGQ